MPHEDLPLTIRPATPDDAGPVSRILNEIVLDGTHSLLGRTFSEVEERAFIAAFPECGVFLVAELRGDGIVAFQALEPYLPDMVAHRHVATMGTWVAAAHRRRGIATRLSEATFAAARERGFRKVFTDIRADNPDSLPFHRSLGFEVVGVARRQARLGEQYVDVVYIEREL